jgi:hypothetical protein
MAFEIHGLILALHYEARFLKNPGSIDRANARVQQHPAAVRRRAGHGHQVHQIPTIQPQRQGVITMPTYTPPLRDMQFVMHEVLNVTDDLKACPSMPTSTCRHHQRGAGRGRQVRLRGGLSAQRQRRHRGLQARPATHAVTTPKGFKEAYAQYVEGGWPALSCDPEFGGQGLPLVVNQCMYEMLNSANQAWTMYPGLTHGAYAALHAHGTPEQKQTYLHKMTSGEWTGTMCLTEPHCGTDLGLMRTKAEPQPDGTYRITGNKIFISAGEHDMADNIIHLVLARLPDAPPGIKGVSLFIVPKFHVNADGTLGERNGIYCGGLEHKMGIHGNATCQIGARWCRRHHGGPAQQGHAGHVRDDECRPPGRGQPVAGPDRGGLPERAGLCQGPHPDALAVRPQGQGQAGRPDHRAPGCAQDAADRQGLCRRRPRAGHLLLGAAGKGALPPGREGAQGQRRDAVAAHPDRQGLPDRQRLDSPPRPACRCLAATATSRNGAWSSLCAMPAST